MDTTKCDHIVGIKENGERNHKLTFLAGDQVDLVKVSEYEKAARYCLLAGNFLEVFKFCPSCGELLEGFDAVKAPIHQRPATPNAFAGY